MFLAGCPGPGGAAGEDGGGDGCRIGRGGKNKEEDGEKGGIAGCLKKKVI